MDNVIKKGAFLLVMILTGCQANMHGSMDDYKGSDSAKIRVLDKGVLSATLYDNQGSCYKDLGTKRLTSFFMLSLIGQADTTISSGKKVNMVHPSRFGNSTINEYVVKGNQLLGISNTTQETTYTGGSTNHTSTLFFIPLVGHEYEISAGETKYESNPAYPIITDLTTDKNDNPDLYKIKVCD